MLRRWQAAILVAALHRLRRQCGAASSDRAQPPAPAPSGSPKPPESAAISITPTGFVLDGASSASYKLDGLRVYQGARITFTNDDVQTHDILSDPPHVHTDCPEINAAGYLVPGQARATEPLTRLVTCGFHDHQGSSFAGKVTVEVR